jgi:hypothetical protein
MFKEIAGKGYQNIIELKGSIVVNRREEINQNLKEQNKKIRNQLVISLMKLMRLNTN